MNKASIIGFGRFKKTLHRILKDDLEIIDKNLQDDNKNYTSFLWLKGGV
jgi:hypothetical protein